MKLSSNTECLFFHLWKKSPKTQQSCPGIFIADTVIYRWAQPYFWYYTNKDGQIVRKTKDKVIIDNIEQIFNEQHKNYNGITSYYMKSSEANKKHIQQDKIEFEYFDNEQFKKFLYQREKSLNALLQKFIQPKDNRNQMIKVTWSPQFCILQRKTNIYDLQNNKIPLNDRLITFEGAENFTKQDSIASPILATDLEYTCLNIVKHIQEVSGGNIQISTMVLYFKLDKKNRLWLLFCTGIKLREKFQINEIDIKNTKERLLSPILTMAKQQISNKNKDQLNKYQIPIGTDICIDCQRNDKMYNIKYKHIVNSFEANLVHNNVQQMQEDYNSEHKKHQTLIDSLGFELDFLKEDNDLPPSNNLPYVLTKVWGKMSDQKYQTLKQNFSWLELEAKVCSECYLKYTKITLQTDEEREINQIIKDKNIKLNKTIQNNLNYENNRNIKTIKSQLNQLQNQYQSFINNNENQENKNKIYKIKNKIHQKQKKQPSQLNQKYSNQNIQKEQCQIKDKNKLVQNNYLKQDQAIVQIKDQNINTIDNNNSCEQNQKESIINDQNQQIFSQQTSNNLQDTFEKYNNEQVQNQNIFIKNDELQDTDSQSFSKNYTKSQKLQKFDPTFAYKSNKNMINLRHLPKINNISLSSNSTNTSSKKIDHGYIINTIKDLKQHLKDL